MRSKIAALLCLLMLTACGGSSDSSGDTQSSQTSDASEGEPVRGGTLVVPTPIDPPTLDLMQESNLWVQEVAVQMYDTLVRIDPDKLPETDELIPWLAEEWAVSDDATELTLSLRSGVTFHDGEKFTAEDVRATIERARDAPDGTVSVQAALLAGVSVETPDELTAVLRSEKPNPGLLRALATPPFAVVPAHIVDRDPHGIEQQPVGTGAFKFVNWDHGSAIEMERNPNYWQQDLPYLDGMRFLVMPDLSTRTSAYVSGNIHISGQGTIIPAAEWETLSAQVPGTQLWEHASPTVFQLWFNSSQEPFDDPGVREAFALVVDQQSIGQRALEDFYYRNGFGGAEGLAFSLPAEDLEGEPGFNPVTDEDLERARDLLAEAGYPDGLEVDYLVGDVPAYVAMAEVYAATLEEIGVTASLRVLPRDTDAVPAMREGRFQMTQAEVAGSIYDPCATLGAYASTSAENYGRYSNPEVDELIGTVCTATGEERSDAALDLQRILWEDLPAVPFPGATYIQGARPEVKGVTHPGLLRENLWYTSVWLDS